MEHIVEIKDMAYIPESLNINKGDTVIWRNKDGMAHTATRNDPPAFDTGNISANTDSRSIRFNENSDKNVFEYFCKPHPFMIGRILVSS